MANATTVSANISHEILCQMGNASNGSVPCPGIGESYFQKILFGVVVPLLFGITTLVGLIGNTLVIYVILSKQKMRTVTNLLLLNLAFADLSFVLICPPFTAYSMATSHWPFGDVACKLMHYLLNVTAYVTVYTLVLISVIRYLTIVHNASTIRFRTTQNTIIMICAIWIVMCALNVPILKSYGLQDIHNTGVEDTCENYGYEVAKRLFATLFVFAYLLPLFVIAVFSIFILRHIQLQRTTMLDHKTKSASKKKKASRLIVLVVVIFAILWLPVHIHILLSYFGQAPDNNYYLLASVMFNVLAYFNSCVNPIIYNYASKDFRDGFREAVCCLGYRPLRMRAASNGNNTTVVTRLTPEANGKDLHLLSEVKGPHDDFDEV